MSYVFSMKVWENFANRLAADVAGNEFVWFSLVHSSPLSLTTYKSNCIWAKASKMANYTIYYADIVEINYFIQTMIDFAMI